MKKTKIITAICLTIVSICGLLFTYQVISTFNKAHMRPSYNEPKVPFTFLSISLNGGDGKVWATAKNDFTLFSSTICVIVQLYSSTTYQEKYTDMTLEYSNSSLNLTKGNTTVAETLTNGEQKYWIGRMRYKVDGNNWREETVGPLLYSEDGNFLGLL